MTAKQREAIERRLLKKPGLSLVRVKPAPKKLAVIKTRFNGGKPIPLDSLFDR